MKKSLLFFFCIVATLACFQACVERVPAEFNFQDNLIFIDAYALTEPGLSSVLIERSVYENDVYSTETILNANVQLENVNTGESVIFLEDSKGLYFSPPDFAAETGESWKLLIDLEDGRRFESSAETVTEAIPIDAIEADFSAEVIYSQSANKYVPGHSVRIDWKDPAGDKNYYLWKYRSYEPLIVCRTCENGILRDDRCQDVQAPAWFNRRHDYLCDTTCWLIRYGDEFPVFEDRLSDGASIADREIAAIPYYRAQDVLVEIQQLSLSESAYDYFKIINDLVSENSGLNAPPPAALLGNIFNPDDETEQILGQFTAAAVATKRTFIDRSNLPASPVSPDPTIRLEDCLNCPFEYPCVESFFRTSTKPEGWPE